MTDLANTSMTDLANTSTALAELSDMSAEEMIDRMVRAQEQLRRLPVTIVYTADIDAMARAFRAVTVDALPNPLCGVPVHIDAEMPPGRVRVEEDGRVIAEIDFEVQP